MSVKCAIKLLQGEERTVDVECVVDHLDGCCKDTRGAFRSELVGKVGVEESEYASRARPRGVIVDTFRPGAKHS
jgi:hypothetical protein